MTISNEEISSRYHVLFLSILMLVLLILSHHDDTLDDDNDANLDDDDDNFGAQMMRSLADPPNVSSALVTGVACHS